MKTNQLMLYRNTIAVYTEIHTKQTNTLCRQNVKRLNVKTSWSIKQLPSFTVFKWLPLIDTESLDSVSRYKGTLGSVINKARLWRKRRSAKAQRFFTFCVKQQKEIFVLEGSQNLRTQFIATSVYMKGCSLIILSFIPLTYLGSRTGSMTNRNIRSFSCWCRVEDSQNRQ
jgi:hypothetical protein